MMNETGVTYRVHNPPSVAWLDRPLLLEVEIVNHDTRTWPNLGMNPVNVSYHWLNEHGQAVDFEGLRTHMDTPLAPGATATIEMQIEPPPHPGTYQLAIDLVEEGISWFSVRGLPPLVLPLTVAPPRSDQPRVCIVNGNSMLHDAVGNHVVNQIRFFCDRGYQTLALLEHIDGRHPAEIRQHMAQVTLDELRNGTNNPQRRRAVTHFQSADLYVFNYSTYYSLAEALRLVSHGVVLFDYHGVTPPHLWQGAGRENLEAGQRNLELVRYADYAIGHSRFTCGELLATGLIAAERVHQMGYVVPLEQFRPGSRPLYLLERYGLRNDQTVLLYVGRMALAKRVQDLVSALALVRKRHPDAVLLLVGDDRSPAYARNVAQVDHLAESLGVSEAVIFTGQVPNDELADHYRLADVFVTASLHEGFCIPVLEAMACGVPVVGAHTTALPETIGAGGLTFTPEDPTDLATKVLAVLEGTRQGVEETRS